MYIPPLIEYVQVTLGFLVGWFLVTRARLFYHYIKYRLALRALRRNLQELDTELVRLRSLLEDINKK